MLVILCLIDRNLEFNVPIGLQVYPDGIRHIRADKRVNEWKAPGKKTIVKCAVNQRQVVIALTGGELVYFEMDPVSIPALNPILSGNRIIVLSEISNP